MIYMHAVLRSIFKHTGPWVEQREPFRKEKEAAREGGERKGCGSIKKRRWRWETRKGGER